VSAGRDSIQSYGKMLSSLRIGDRERRSGDTGEDFGHPGLHENGVTDAARNTVRTAVKAAARSATRKAAVSRDTLAVMKMTMKVSRTRVISRFEIP